MCEYCTARRLMYIYQCGENCEFFRGPMYWKFELSEPKWNGEKFPGDSIKCDNCYRTANPKYIAIELKCPLCRWEAKVGSNTREVKDEKRQALLDFEDHVKTTNQWRKEDEQAEAKARASIPMPSPEKERTHKPRYMTAYGRREMREIYVHMPDSRGIIRFYKLAGYERDRTQLWKRVQKYSVGRRGREELWELIGIDTRRKKEQWERIR